MVSLYPFWPGRLNWNQNGSQPDWGCILRRLFWAWAFRSGSCISFYQLLLPPFYFSFSPSIVYFHSVTSLSRLLQSGPKHEENPLKKSHARGWKTQGLETVTDITISNVNHESSCLFSPRRSLKCPNLSNCISFRYSQPFFWKVIAYLMIFFFSKLSLEFFQNTSSLLPGQIHCASAPHFCTYPSLHIHGTTLKWHVHNCLMPGWGGFWGCDTHAFTFVKSSAYHSI